MRVVVAVALVAVMALSGCIAGAATGTSLHVRVTDEPGGPPLAGAEVDVGEAGLCLWWCYHASATTNANGEAVFHPPSDAVVYVALPGHTSERVERHGEGTVEVPLYHDHITLDMRGNLTGADATSRPTPLGERWAPVEVPFSGSAAARQGYAERAIMMNATLKWSNAPLATGDLALGVSPRTDRAVVWQDSSDAQVVPGEQKESVHLSISDLQVSDWRGATKVYVGPGPGKAYVAPLQPIAWTIHVDAVFGSPRDAPTTLVWGTLLALVTAAMLLRPASSRPR